MEIVIIFSILSLISLAILGWIVSMFFGYAVTRVPFVPTAARDIREIAKRVTISKDDVIYDLGSGNGKVAFMLADLTGAKTVGLEAMTWAYLYSQVKKVLRRSSRTRFELGNFFKKDWSEATVIYCYLFPHLMSRVGGKILSDCSPGTRVIVRDFAIPNLPQIDHFTTYANHEIFVYKI